MFTSSRSPSSRYQVATETGWPSSRTVVMTAGFGCASRSRTLSGKGSLGTVAPRMSVRVIPLTTMTTSSELFPTDRLSRAQEAVRAAGVDALLVSPSADLRYLTGYNAHPLERLTCL